MTRKFAVFLLLLSIWTVPVMAQGGDDPAYGNRLFVDDFTTFVNNWDRAKSAKLTVDYADFSYQFDIRSPGVSFWSMPRNEMELDQYIIEVTATVNPTSAPDGVFGVMFNQHDASNFYVLVINAAGDYAVRLWMNGQWAATPLVSEQAEPSEAYRLQVQNDQGTFQVSVNDSPPAAFAATELAGGAFGLYAEAGHGGLFVTFDDYVVYDLPRN